MKTPRATNAEHVANALRFARLRVERAESRVKETKQQARVAKRRRKAARQAARRARKLHKQAKAELAEARQALEDAQQRLARTRNRPAKTKKPSRGHGPAKAPLAKPRKEQVGRRSRRRPAWSTAAKAGVAARRAKRNRQAAQATEATVAPTPTAKDWRPSINVPRDPEVAVAATESLPAGEVRAPVKPASPGGSVTEGGQEQ
jgi:hypothetical protein